MLLSWGDAEEGATGTRIGIYEVTAKIGEGGIKEVLDETELKITRKNIWEKVGYKDASEFERWQRCDKRVSRTASERFTAVLREKPHLR